MSTLNQFYVKQQILCLNYILPKRHHRFVFKEIILFFLEGGLVIPLLAFTLTELF